MNQPRILHRNLASRSQSRSAEPRYTYWAVRASAWLVRGVVLGVVLGTASCARYQYLNVVSEPAGAEVFVDGQSVGKTPMQVTVDRDRDHLVYLKLDGYVPVEQVLTLNRVPDRIDFLTPADVELRLGRRPNSPGDDRRDVNVDLEKEDSTP